MRLFDTRKKFDLLTPFLKGHSISGRARRAKKTSLDDIINEHFLKIPNHPCKETLSLALECLNQKPAHIIETGSSAWGANSTMLFDSYVNSFGGQLSSVDIRATPMIDLSFKCTDKTKLHCSDSIAFLEDLELDKKIQNLFYFDSWDVDWADPSPSMQHGLNEYLTISKSIKKDDLILIDDTPKSAEFLINIASKESIQHFSENQHKGITGGKGSLVLDLITKNKSAEIISHKYQLLFKIL